ncbi:MAG: hypothetical protein JWM19_1603 [Actinomycetia bacterium]|nr:hypothetical protein [Actinomycetes bacterium]
MRRAVSVSDSERRGRGIGHHPAKNQESRGQRPGEALIVGGFSSLGHGPGGPYAHRRARRRDAARVAAPLAVPLALGVTLGVILAVSSGPSQPHVAQRTSGGTTSTSAAPIPSPSATGPSATSPSATRG